MEAQLIERFHEKYIPEPMSGCWLWEAGVCNHGYARFRSPGDQYGHRFSWRIHRGNIPSGLHVLHKCDTPACVNPDHLFLGTHLDNMADMTAKGRSRKIRSEDAPRGKLTTSDAIAIRADRRRSRFVALEYGVSRQTIHNIRTRRTWVALDG